MPCYTGSIRKMEASDTDPIDYKWVIGNTTPSVNEAIGNTVSFLFKGEIHCIVCNKKIKKSFNQGFCYPCFIDAPESSECIIRPELCRAHEGIGRDMDWEQKHHLQPTSLYLALSSGVKVGITKTSSLVTRWIDQGASQGLSIATFPNRYLAGLGEVALKAYLSDRTAWQKMLKNDIPTDINLASIKNDITPKLPKELQAYVSSDTVPTQLNYPVLQYPTACKSVSFDKTPLFEGKLLGIKGQYLLFEHNYVLNIRKHTGYFISISF